MTLKKCLQKCDHWCNVQSARGLAAVSRAVALFQVSQEIAVCISESWSVRIYQ